MQFPCLVERTKWFVNKLVIGYKMKCHFLNWHSIALYNDIHSSNQSQNLTTITSIPETASDYR